MGIHKGKPFSYPTLWTALKVSGAKIDLPYDVPGGMASFQKTLATSFLFKVLKAVFELAVSLNSNEAQVMEHKRNE